VTAPRWLPAAAVTLFAAALAWFNRGERVAIDVGVATFYRAPLSVVLFAVFLAGMLAMLLLSLRHDRRVRDELRRHGLLQPEEPPARTASAWGVAREPARGEDAGRTVAYPRRDESDDADRAVGYPRRDENEAAERTVAYRRLDGDEGTDRTIAYPGDDEREGVDRTVAYRRYDEDPAA
jgi:uncharacterized integral membrane protein